MRALLMGVREPGMGVRLPETGVMPAHLPAEQVCPAAQHTCSAAHEAALKHNPYGCLAGGLPEDDTRWMRPDQMQPNCSVDTQNSCLLPVAESGALHYKFARRCPGTNHSGQVCCQREWECPTPLHVRAEGQHTPAVQGTPAAQHDCRQEGQSIYIPLQAEVLMSVKRQFWLCLTGR
jgi:hypothetical protein